MDPEPGPPEENASEHVSVELPASLVSNAREAGVDVEAVCRAAISTALSARAGGNRHSRPIVVAT